MIRFPYGGQVTTVLVSVVLIGMGVGELFRPSVSHPIDNPETVELRPSALSNLQPLRLSRPTTNAKAAALMDVKTGRLLFSQQGDAILPMASTTKIMTAIVALEHGRLHDRVKVSRRAFGKEGSSIYLKLGEEMSLNHLLYGLMLRSGNDAAVAIAEHVGGSEEGFVYLMNEKAKLLGLKHTQFRNPHGLDANGHYTTAKELAQLTAYALHNSTFREIVRTVVKVAPNQYEKWDYKWMNKNKMLRLYEGADGVKTGYTSDALRCLVSSATRNGQQLVAVTLSDGRDWVDHSKMLDYGFQSFPMETIVQKGDQISTYSLQASHEVAYPLGMGERQRIEMDVNLVEKHSLDARLGHCGQLIVKLDGHAIAQVPLVKRAVLKDPPVEHTATPVQKWFMKVNAVMSSLLDPA